MMTWHVERQRRDNLLTLHTSQLVVAVSSCRPFYPLGSPLYHTRTDSEPCFRLQR